MTDMGFLQRKNKLKGLTEEAMPPVANPNVQKFLNDFMVQQEAVRDMQAALRERDLELDKLRGRCDWQERELERLMRTHEQKEDKLLRKSDGFSRGYHAQQAEIAVLVTAAEAAKEQALSIVVTEKERSVTAIKSVFSGFSDAVNAAMAAIDKMVAEDAGEERRTPLPPAPLLSEEDVVSIGRTFGANARKPEEDVG